MKIRKIEDDKLATVLKQFEFDFPENFSESIMQEIRTNPKDFQLEKWSIAFRRIVIPAAAILVFLISFTIYNKNSQQVDGSEKLGNLNMKLENSLVLTVYQFK